MSVGEILKELREEKHMNQEQLGKVLGVSGRQISNYECNNQIFRDEKSFQKNNSSYNGSYNGSRTCSMWW